MWMSTKTFGHDLGISACFRQPKATHSHCSKLHGYALAFTFTFGCLHLDDKNWAVDFGGLKDLKARLVDTFDHKTCVDAKDPELDWFMEAAKRGVIDLTVFERGVGCERFAQYAFEFAEGILKEAFPADASGKRRVFTVQVECREHGSNSAIYMDPWGMRLMGTQLNREFIAGD